MDNCFFTKIKPEYYDSIKDYRDEMLRYDSEFDGCSSLNKYDDIEKWKLNCDLFEHYDTLPPGYSIGYEYIYVDNDEVVGMLNLRPEALSHPFLKQYGGHIGYSIKPSKRKMGYGTRMLKDFIKEYRDMFIDDKILITCMKDNIASKKVILNSGGVYESEIVYPPNDKVLERYWIKLEN